MPARRLLLAAALAAAIATPSLAQTDKVTVALDWTPNTNHIGLYVAEAKGYFADAGLAVEILPYSDTSAGTLVANQVADFGVLSALSLFLQHSAGADLVGTYAIVQTETGRVVFNADRTDIQSPRDLDGLVYGGFGSAWEDALIGTIIRHDGGKGEFENVTLGTSAYEALANGAIDFTLEVYTWEGIKAELDGVAQRRFRYDDYGVPDQHTGFIGSSQAYLDANPETARAFTQAVQQGYAFAVANPDEATDILLAASGDGLSDRTFIRASLQALIEGGYLANSDGVVGTIQPAMMDALGDYLLSNGILRDDAGQVLTERPDFSRYYTNQFLVTEPAS
jgi:ABC-type nitrate/sulfonate/bicarbonate transport system substrate-binding protein